MLPPLFLGPKVGESVLDMAAAPGGKTTQMAAMTGNQAQITACEKNKARSEKLKYNLEKQGASGTYVMVEDARKLDDFFSFDRILLDAPCSGSGTVEVRDGICRTKISKELVERSARTQEELLKKALKLLKSGHEMVYSTCSILKEENEGLLKRVLKSAGGELVPIGEDWTKELPLLPNAMPGTLLVNCLRDFLWRRSEKNRSSVRNFYFFAKNALNFYSVLRFSTSIRFSSGMIVISIVRMQAVPPMTLETGSARNTPSVPICMA